MLSVVCGGGNLKRRRRQSLKPFFLYVVSMLVCAVVVDNVRVSCWGVSVSVVINFRLEQVIIPKRLVAQK